MQIPQHNQLFDGFDTVFWVYALPRPDERFHLNKTSGVEARVRDPNSGPLNKGTGNRKRPLRPLGNGKHISLPRRAMIQRGAPCHRHSGPGRCDEQLPGVSDRDAANSFPDLLGSSPFD
jgi:hypothetical protein